MNLRDLLALFALDERVRIEDAYHVLFNGTVQDVPHQLLCEHGDVIWSSRDRKADIVTIRMRYYDFHDYSTSPF